MSQSVVLRFQSDSTTHLLRVLPGVALALAADAVAAVVAERRRRVVRPATALLRRSKRIIEMSQIPYFAASCIYSHVKVLIIIQSDTGLNHFDTNTTTYDRAP